MRRARPLVRVLGPLVLGALVSTSAPALAQTVRLEQPAEVLNRPRGSGRLVIKLEKGDKIRVLQKKGDWVEVVARGEKGWIPATVLEPPATGFAAGQAVTTLSAELRTRAGGKGKVLFEVEPGEPFKIVKQDGEYVEVIDETETRGWLPAAAVASAEKKSSKRAVAKAEPAEAPPSKWGKKAAPAPAEEEKVTRKTDDTSEEDAFEIDGEEPAAEAEETEEEPVATASDDDEEADDEAPASDTESDAQAVGGSFTKRFMGGLRYHVGADVAVLSVRQDFKAEGTGLRNNYALTNNTPALVLRGTVGSRVGRWIYGIDASGHYTFMGGGMTNGDDASMDEALTWKEFAMEASLHGSYVIDPQWTAGASLGGYRWKRSVEADEMLALPSEASGGVTLGLRGGWHKDAWSADAGFDYVVHAGLRQRSGLRDGASSSVSGMRYRLVGGYRINGDITAEAGYHGTRGTYSFDGEAERSTAEGRRKETSHLVTVGASYKF